MPSKPKIELRRTKAPQRSLVLAFVLVTASFVAATAYSQFWVSGIHKSATDIATSAAPSIEELAAMRADVSALALGLRGMAQERSSFDEAAVRGWRSGFERDVQAYLTLADPEDKEIEQRLSSAAETFEKAADGMTAALKANDLATAQRLSDDEVTPAAVQVSSAILAAMISASKEATALAQGIESTRESSMRIAFVLNLFCAVAATFAAVVVSRVVRDYSAVVESRNELLAVRAEELEAFASRVAHDIVNPLGTIKLGLELVSQRVADPAVAPIVSRTLRSVDRAVLIVRDLLAFARANTEPSPDASVDLRAVASTLVDELAEEARAARVSVDITDVPSSTVACAPGILTSILSNLVRNAIKYMGDRAVRTVTMQARERDGRVLVDVIDTGPGITPDKLSLIWLPYVRGSGAAEHPGMGLGLATVKRLVEGHGGKVSVSSAPGYGSMFSFELPLRAAQDAAVERGVLVRSS